MPVAILGDYLNETLSIYSKQGRKVIEIGRDGDGGYIEVNNNRGKPAVVIAIRGDSQEGFISVSGQKRSR